MTYHLMLEDNMKTNTIEVVVTEQMLNDFNFLKQTRMGKSDSELWQQVVSRGLYDIKYRTNRNKQQWAETKEALKMYRDAQK